MNTNLKIVAINGSHRGEKGYTRFLIDRLFSGAVKAGAICEAIDLKNYRINPCIGCRKCHTTNHYLKCVFDDKDDVHLIFDKMREADILVFATPVYIFNMTGLMKTFLDRITSTADSGIMKLSESGLFFHHIDKKLISKPFVLITTQDNFENATSDNIISYFRTFSKFLDAPVAGIIRRKSGKMVGHGTDKESESHFPEIRNVYEAIERAGTELVRFGKISKSTERKTSRNVIKMPKMIEFLLKFNAIRKNKRFMSAILERAGETKSYF
jgi:multimeric flavodoxin WrbA